MKPEIFFCFVLLNAVQVFWFPINGSVPWVAGTPPSVAKQTERPGRLSAGGFRPLTVVAKVILWFKGKCWSSCLAPLLMMLFQVYVIIEVRSGMDVILTETVGRVHIKPRIGTKSEITCSGTQKPLKCWDLNLIVTEPKPSLWNKKITCYCIVNVVFLILKFWSMNKLCIIHYDGLSIILVTYIICNSLNVIKLLSKL